MEITHILAFIGVVSPIVAVLAYVKGTKKEIKTEGHDQGELKADIKYIRSGVEDIKLDMRTQGQKIEQITERLTRVEESTKLANQRIDEIKKLKGE